MAHDFYCDEVLSGRTVVRVVRETAAVLAYHHTKPFWPVHILVIPKKHVASLLELPGEGDALMRELLGVVVEVPGKVRCEHGASRVLTNLGVYQDSIADPSAGAWASC